MAVQGNSQKKRKVNKKRLLVGIMFLVIMFVFGSKNIISVLHQKRQISDLTQGIEEIKQKNEVLLKEINALKTNPTRIEEYARQIGMMRPKEKKIKFMPKEEDKN